MKRHQDWSGETCLLLQGIFGLGGETDAYKSYTVRKTRYQEELDSFPARKEKYASDKKVFDDLETRLTEATAGLTRTRELVSVIKADIDKASAGLGADTAERSRQDVIEYRKRTEARLEGLLDLKKNGKITPENIFAFTWLKKAECMGKPASDPEARKALCAFIAANTVQNDILNGRFKGAHKDARTSDALDQRKINSLNSGDAVNALMNDNDLMKLLDSMGDARIDPEDVNTQYTGLVAAKATEAGKDINIYTRAKDSMERDFRQQELSTAALDEVLRYQMLQRAINARHIRVYDNADKGLAVIFGTKFSDEDRKPYMDAMNELKSQGKGPMGLREMAEALDSKKKELDKAREAQPQNNNQHIPT